MSQITENNEQEAEVKSQSFSSPKKKSAWTKYRKLMLWGTVPFIFMPVLNFLIPFKPIRDSLKPVKDIFREKTKTEKEAEKLEKEMQKFQDSIWDKNEKQQDSIINAVKERGNKTSSIELDDDPALEVSGLDAYGFDGDGGETFVVTHIPAIKAFPDNANTVTQANKAPAPIAPNFTPKNA